MINFKKIFRRRKNITKAGIQLSELDYYLIALGKSLSAGHISLSEYEERCAHITEKTEHKKQ